MNAGMGTPQLTAAQKRALLAKLLQEKREQGRPAPEAGFLARFAEQVSRFPRALAVVDGDTRLTFADLNARAEDLARRLRVAGVGRDVIVGVAVPPSAARIVAILAILKAGGAVLPLEPSDAVARRERILRRLKPSVVLAEGSPAQDFAGAKVIAADAGGPVAEDRAQGLTHPAEGDLCFVTCPDETPFLLEHRVLAARLGWLRRTFPLSRGEVVLDLSPLHGDGLILGVLWPLAAGAAIAVAPDGVSDPDFTHLIDDAGVSVAHGLAASQIPLEGTSLRLVLVGGPVPTRLKDAPAQRGIEVHGLYSLPQAGGPVAVHGSGGREPDPAFAILDTDRRPTPVGVVGEIHLGGPLVRGEEAPFPTGERARQRSDGGFEWLGVAEGRALVQGHRVSRADVAATILACEGIADCHVVTREGEDGDSRLVAYVVPGAKGAGERLKDWIAAHLAPWQRPICVPVSAIPLTGAGLADERFLFSLPVLEEGWEHRWERLTTGSSAVAEIAFALQPATVTTGEIPLPVLPPLPVAGKPSPGGSGGIRPLAVADGGPLTLPADAPRTLTEALLRTASEQSGKGITFLSAHGGQDFLTYAGLLARALCFAGGLRAGGLASGQVVILQVPNLRDYFPVFWGCVLAGARPVTVACDGTYRDRNAVVAKLLNVWRLLDHPPILAAEELCLPIRDLSRFTQGSVPDVRSIAEMVSAESLQEPWPAAPEDVLFLQLSSGSTGIPKCIRIAHRGVVAHIHGGAAFNGYSGSDVSMNWLPMDHVVPLLTCHLRDTYLGCSQVVTDTASVLADPLRWLDAIDAYRVTRTWAPNFGFKIVAEAIRHAPGRGWDLSCVKSFMNAGEQVTLPVIRAFLDATAPFGVKPSAMQPSFGMAEACTCMTFENDFSPERSVFWIAKETLGGALRLTTSGDRDAIGFVKLGPPVPGVQIRIADADNVPLPEGTIGRFQIKGDVITPGYDRNDEANREAFVGDGWFNSGDLGFILDGTLALTGREKELIIVNGANFYCYEIEDVVNQADGILPTYAAACGVPVAETGTEALAIFFVPRDGVEPEPLVAAIRRHVTMLTGLDPAHIVPVARSDFPKTTSGKIQRRFLRERLMAELNEQAAKRSVPDHFFREVWVPCAVQRGPNAADGVTLIFRDHAGLGEALARRLEALGQSWIDVRTGADYGFGPDGHATLDPENVTHYARLFDDLRQSGRLVGDVAFLWPADTAREGPKTLASFQSRTAEALGRILDCLKALAASAKGGAVRFTVVSRQALPVAGGTDPVLGGMRGLLRTAAQEMPSLTVRQIDLAEPADGDAERLLKEWHALPRDPEVAWRQGIRRVPRLDKVGFDTATRRPRIRLRDGGRYLVTGGAGGIGREIVRFLRATCRAQVLVVGRTPAEDLGSTWPAGGEGILYRSVDMADGQAVEAALLEAEVHFGGPLEGVFHLAGTAQDRLLRDETRESLAEALHAKVAGAWTLHHFLAGRPGSWLVSWSSVNALFGGLRAGAYSAANSALDALMQGQDTEGAPRLCLHWSRWDAPGMSSGPGMREFAQARGYLTLAVEPALAVLPHLLADGGPGLAIGLDAGNPQIASRLAGAPWPLTAPKAYFVPRRTAVDGGSSVAFPLPKPLQDVLGRDVSCEMVELEALPRDASGEVDRERLASTAGRQVDARSSSETEMRLGAIWSELLGRAHVAPHDNFFESGGHSLVAARLLYRISEAFGIDMPLRILFEKPTLGAMAAWIASAQGSEVEARPPLPACVVALNPEGEQRPFFCTHPAGGSPWCYLGLAHHLGAGQPFYGFQSPGLVDGATPIESVEELASVYVGAMRAVQPKGPYRIGGWSSGGPVAYEMARIVERSGDTVEVLALFDCGLMESDMMPGRPRILRMLRGLWQLGTYLRQVKFPRSYGELKFLAQLIGLPLPHSFKQLKIDRAFLSALEHSRRMFNLNNTIGIKYRPQPYGGRVILFRAGSVPSGRDPILTDLMRYAARIERVDVPGNHMSIILDPDESAVLASRLKDALEGRTIHGQGDGETYLPC